ncbi:MAG TPA: DivIVA domain-containing protein [Acidimicrobiales bacterium]
MTEQAAERPRFAIVMRGYDRDQVDAYLAEYERWAGDAQSHIEAGEARLAAAARRVQSLESKVADLEERSGDTLPPSVRSLGERAEQILRDAWDAAQELRGNIVSEAEEEREKSRHASDELVAAAEGQAAEIAEDARHQRDEAGQEVDRARKQVEQFIKEAEEGAEERAQAVWDEAQVQLSEARKELDRLEEQRRATLGELARLRELLEGVIGGGNGPRGPGETVPPGGDADDQADATKETARVERDPAADESREVDGGGTTKRIQRVSDDTAEQAAPRQRRPNGGRRPATKSA